MDGGDERQPQGEAAKAQHPEAPMPPVTVELGPSFLQRQLKDLLVPSEQPRADGMAPHEPAAPLAGRQPSPALLTSIWPAKAGGEAQCAPAERPLNGTTQQGPPQQQQQGAAGGGGDHAAVVAAAAALAEPSPAPVEAAGPAAAGGSGGPQEAPHHQQQQQADVDADAAEHAAEPDGLISLRKFVPLTVDDLGPVEGGQRSAQDAQPEHQAQPEQPAAQQQPAAAGPPSPQQEQPAAPAGGGAEPPAVQQPEPPAAPAMAGAAALEGILNRLSGLDAEGWFHAPVREVDAPNYYKIIKKPMCFQVMRAKVREQRYVNWNEVVRDFELICSNAMKYNQKRSRIHKLALVMLRAGKKLLVEIEPEGRRAVAELQAGAQAAAAAQQALLLHGHLGGGGGGKGGYGGLLAGVMAEQQDSQAVPSSLLRSELGLTSATGLTGAPSSHPLLARSLSTMDTATTSETRGGAGGLRAAGGGAFGGFPWDPTELDPPAPAPGAAAAAATAADGGGDAAATDAGAAAPGGEAAYYSSYSDTDLEEEPGEAAAAPQQRQGPGEGGSAGFPPGLEQLQHAADAVLSLPYTDGAAAPAHADVQPDGAAQQAAPAAVAGRPGGGARVWKQSRRSVEWRLRWLELRMRELAHQRARHTAALQARHQAAAVEAAGAAASPAAAAGPQQEPAPQPAGQQPELPGAAAAAAGAGPSHEPHPRRPLSDLQLPGLLGHPFFGEHSVVGGKRSAAQQAAAAAAQQQQQPGAGGGPPPAAAPAELAEQAQQQQQAQQAQQDAEVQLDDPDYPARAHMALDLLERRLGALRHELLALQRPGSFLGLGGAAAAAAHRPHLLLLPHRGGAAGAGPGRPRSGPGRPPGSGTATPRSRSGLGAPAKPGFRDRDGLLGKRRRANEYDINDVITPGAMGAPKYVERAQVKTIDTPKVRLLPAAEVKRREAALAAYASNLREGQPEPQAAAPLRAACPGEEGESSEEEIGDEAYAARHRPLAAAERARYESFASGGGQAQRNKKPTKVTKERSKLTKPSRSYSASLLTPIAGPGLGLTPTHSFGGGGLGSAGGLAGAGSGGTPASAPPALAGLPPSAQASAPLRGAAAGGGTPAPPAATPAPAAAAHMQAPAAASGAVAAASGSAGSPAALPRNGSSGQLAEVPAARPRDGSEGAPPPGELPPTAASAAAVPPLGPAAANGDSGSHGGARPAPQQQPQQPQQQKDGDGSGAAAAAAGKPAAGREGKAAPCPGATVPVSSLHGDLPPALQAIVPNGPPAPSRTQPPLRDGRASGRPRGRPRLRPK